MLTIAGSIWLVRLAFSARGILVDFFKSKDTGETRDKLHFSSFITEQF